MDKTQTNEAEAGSAQQLLTPQQAAAYLGVTIKALENWRGTGAGPAFIRLSARCIRYVRGDLDSHIWGSRHRSTAEAG